jgi:hypothetical protein
MIAELGEYTEYAGQRRQFRGLNTTSQIHQTELVGHAVDGHSRANSKRPGTSISSTTVDG